MVLQNFGFSFTDYRSGKSSLVLSLFGIREITGGSIVIDGVDIRGISRQFLRSRLIAVSQETFLFDGSVRANLDQLGTAPDVDITSAFQKAQLWETVRENGGLDNVVDTLQLSHGQRQLLSIARAMLRKGSIVIIGEATSRYLCN